MSIEMEGILGLNARVTTRVWSETLDSFGIQLRLQLDPGHWAR